MATPLWDKFPSLPPAQDGKLKTNDKGQGQFDRLCRWTALVLGGAVLAIGCTPGSLGFLLLPFSDTKIQPECKLASRDKEVTLLIMASFANLETRPEFMPVDGELCDCLAKHLRKRFHDNKEKIVIVPFAKVKSYLNKTRDRDFVTKQDIGKYFKADYVINLEINSMSLFERGSAGTLLRGYTDISVTAIDVSQAAGEAPLFARPYHCEYPEMAGLDRGNSDPLQFRSLFLERVAKDLSKYFAAYSIEDRREMR